MDLPRALACALLASLLVPAAAQALPAPRADTAQAEARFADATALLRAFGLPFASDAGKVQARTAANATLDLRPVGDVDHDGADDLVAVVHQYGDKGQRTGGKAQALSGRGLQAVLWSTDLAEDQDAEVAPDLDGDGFADVVRLTGGDAAFSGQSASALVAGAGTWTLSMPEKAEFLSGRDLKPLASQDGGVGWDQAGADAYPAGGYASAQKETFTWTEPLALGGSTYGSLSTARDSASSYAFGPAGFVFGSSDRSHVAFTAGSGTVAFDGDLQDVRSVTTSALDAKAGLDLVVLYDEGAASASAYTPAGYSTTGTAQEHHVAAVAGADATVLWDATFEADPTPALQSESAALGVGDLDGDGAGDVEYVTLRLGVDTTVTATATFLSGKDGSVLQEVAQEGTFTVGLPFGDVDADGKAEMLALSIDAAAGTASVGAAKPDLVPLWSVPLTDDQEPFFLEEGLETGVWPDWTGDRAPDLVLYASDEGAFEASAYDGRTGKVAWSLGRTGIVEAAAVADVSGTGAADLFLAASSDLADPAAATFSFEVLAGESGSALLASSLGQPNGTFDQVEVTARTLGNLDGAGGPELGVRLRLRSEDHAVPPTDAWRIYPGTAGAETLVVAPPPAEAAAGNGTAPAPPVQVSREAPAALNQAPSQTVEPAKGSPAAAPVALAAVLAAAVAWARRRKA